MTSCFRAVLVSSLATSSHDPMAPLPVSGIFMFFCMLYDMSEPCALGAESQEAFMVISGSFLAQTCLIWISLSWPRPWATHFVNSILDGISVLF